MAGLSIASTGGAAARVDRFKAGSNDSVYIADGESTSLARCYLTKVAVAESGSPALQLVNDTDNQRLDVYSVRGAGATRVRPLMPQRARDVTLASGETLLLIPIVIETPTASTRRKRT